MMLPKDPIKVFLKGEFARFLACIFLTALACFFVNGLLTAITFVDLFAFSLFLPALD
jgi:hypothetical protein